MGRAVVHFEITGKDHETLTSFYSQLFDWKIETAQPIGYGMVDRESNLNAEGIGIGGGVFGSPEAGDGHVTFYVEVPSVEKALAQAERLGGKRVMGPDQVPGGPTLGQFTDPEGHMVGVVEAWAAG